MQIHPHHINSRLLQSAEVWLHSTEGCCFTWSYNKIFSLFSSVCVLISVCVCVISCSRAAQQQQQQGSRLSSRGQLVVCVFQEVSVLRSLQLCSSAAFIPLGKDGLCEHFFLETRFRAEWQLSSGRYLCTWELWGGRWWTLTLWRHADFWQFSSFPGKQINHLH